MGATNPASAAPGTFRGDFALSMPDNLVHGSDSPESAEREIALWFAADELPDGLTDHARQPRGLGRRRGEMVELGERAGANDRADWGIWAIPESELRVLPDVDGKDVIELGCGTGHWSAWLARRGARVVGLDNSARQLETARRLSASTVSSFR